MPIDWLGIFFFIVVPIVFIAAAVTVVIILMVKRKTRFNAKNKYLNNFDSIQDRFCCSIKMSFTREHNPNIIGYYTCNFCRNQIAF